MLPNQIDRAMLPFAVVVELFAGLVELSCAGARLTPPAGQFVESS